MKGKTYPYVRWCLSGTNNAQAYPDPTHYPPHLIACGVSPTWPMTAIPPSTIFRMCSARFLPPSSFTASTLPSCAPRTWSGEGHHNRRKRREKKKKTSSVKRAWLEKRKCCLLLVAVAPCFRTATSNEKHFPNLAGSSPLVSTSYSGIYSTGALFFRTGRNR